MGLFAALFTAVRADSSPMGGELGFCVYAVMHRDVLLLSLGDEGFVLYIYIFFFGDGLGVGGCGGSGFWVLPVPS